MFPPMLLPPRVVFWVEVVLGKVVLKREGRCWVAVVFVDVFRPVFSPVKTDGREVWFCWPWEAGVPL